jgi:hypothetical protein
MIPARILRSLVALSMTVAFPSFAQTKPKTIAEELNGEARAAFEQGKDLFEHEDYVTAHAKLERAHELSANPRILWNLAACAAKQKRYALAIAEAERYLLEGGSKLTPEQTDRAQRFVEELRGLVAEATFSVAPAGAKLTIDRTPRGLLGAPTVVLLDLGAHVVQLEKDGFEIARANLDITKVGKQSYAFTLVELVKMGRLAVATDVDALIEIDGKPVAKGVYETALTVGPHRVRIAAPDREPHEGIVEVTDGATKQVSVALAPQRKDSVAWWPWGVIGAVAVGAGIGGYYVFKPRDTVGQPVEGSIGTIRIGN